jgi:hypothetical protein
MSHHNSELATTTIESVTTKPFCPLQIHVTQHAVAAKSIVLNDGAINKIDVRKVATIKCALVNACHVVQIELRQRSASIKRA